MQEVTPPLSDLEKRLDTWLHETYPEKSRSFWQKKIKSGEVRVNKRKMKPHYTLRENDQIKINLKDDSPTISGEKIPLEIVFEDKNYAIINKPAGLVVHPGTGNTEHTLVNALIHHFGKDLSSTNPERPGIVHRLDKDTSGLLVIAKNDESHQFLAKQFEKREVKKTYIALVANHLSPKEGSIEAPLNRNEKNRQKISISTRSGSRYALTHYKVQKYFKRPEPATLLEVTIETGRTHQIRVHLSSIDHFVLGDTTYGRPKLNNKAAEHGLHRQFLHAANLSFKSPTTKKKVHYKSPLPEDLKSFLEKLY